MAFRCIVRQGNIGRKAPESLNGRIHACWINPYVDTIITPPPPASAATPAKVQQRACGAGPPSSFGVKPAAVWPAQRDYLDPLLASSVLISGLSYKTTFSKELWISSLPLYPI
jgi:hypothetical protein